LTFKKANEPVQHDRCNESDRSNMRNHRVFDGDILYTLLYSQKIGENKSLKGRNIMIGDDVGNLLDAPHVVCFIKLSLFIVLEAFEV
jgi:hypothetical protein